MLIATFFFAIELYSDFSGYTDIAIGCAKILGYELTQNFKFPYLSNSIQDFWRRWHISLTSWFKDYLYIPLGGNRMSKSRNYINIFIVFLISGIWHGANWTFIIWGIIHGIYQIIGRFTREIRRNLIKNLGVNNDGVLLKVWNIIITFILVDFAWIFFRANSLSDAIYIVRNMFVDLKNLSTQNIGLNLGNGSFKKMVFVVLLLVGIEIIQQKRTIKSFLIKQPAYVRFILYYMFIMIILMFGIWPVNGITQFMYTKF